MSATMMRAQPRTLKRRLAESDHTFSRTPDAHGQRGFFEQEHDDAEQKLACR
jgi:hypothetical protein